MSLSRIAIVPDRSPSDREADEGRRTGSHLVGGNGDRDHLLERLQQLRRILPVFAQELANARRQTAALRVENRGLLEEVRRLRAQRGESGPPRPSLGNSNARMELRGRRHIGRELDRVAG